MYLILEKLGGYWDIQSVKTVTFPVTIINKKINKISNIFIRYTVLAGSGWTRILVGMDTCSHQGRDYHVDSFDSESYTSVNDFQCVDHSPPPPKLGLSDRGLRYERR